MTERKPAGMSFRSWIDQQIEDAADRGLFDDLPGAGKPLPKRDEDAARAWLREYLRREGLSTRDVLPTPLRLRKGREVLAEMAPALPSEADVRNAVADLNGRITEWRRFPLDSPIFVPLVDEDQMVSLWRDAHPEPDPGLPSGGDARPRDPAGSRRQRPWWRRRSRNS